MDAFPVARLRLLLTAGAWSPADGPDRLRSVLLDETLGRFVREINVLAAAVRERIPDALAARPPGPSPTAVLNGLVRRLEDHGIAPDLAAWAVSAWAEALDRPAEQPLAAPTGLTLPTAGGSLVEQIRLAEQRAAAARTAELRRRVQELAAAGDVAGALQVAEEIVALCPGDADAAAARDHLRARLPREAARPPRPWLINLLHQRFAGLPNTSVAPDVGAARRRAAVRTYADRLQPGEEILLVYSAAVFGGVGKGFVITETGLGWKDGWFHNPTRRPWAMLDPAAIRWDAGFGTSGLWFTPREKVFVFAADAARIGPAVRDTVADVRATLGL
jgi:hypothetical protein